jgi:alpha-galactosidase
MPIWLDASEAEQSWTLENDLVRRVVAFEPGRGLSTSRLTCQATRREYVGGRGTAEFSFRCDGQPCASNDGQFELVDARTDGIAGGKSLTVRLRSRKFPLEAAAVYRVYDGHPALRKHLLLRNTGGSPLLLTHLNVETLELEIGPENEMTLLTQYGTVPREIFYTGRSEDAGLLVKNAVTGDGMAIVSEVPGYMKRTEIAGWDAPDGVRIGVMYDTDLMPFERRIVGGEEFATAAASVVPFREGDGFNDPQWSVPGYAAQVLERRVDAQGPPWIYNTWEPFERGINQAIALELIDAAGAMGMDIFTIDDGRQQEYRETGENLNEITGGR